MGAGRTDRGIITQRTADEVALGSVLAYEQMDSQDDLVVAYFFESRAAMDRDEIFVYGELAATPLGMEFINAGEGSLGDPPHLELEVYKPTKLREAEEELAMSEANMMRVRDLSAQAREIKEQLSWEAREVYEELDALYTNAEESADVQTALPALKAWANEVNPPRDRYKLNQLFRLRAEINALIDEELSNQRAAARAEQIRLQGEKARRRRRGE
jgi:hypothetical protein